MKIITDERCVTFSQPGHPERPARITRTLEKLRSQTDLPLTWAKPIPASDAAILRAHSPMHLVRLQEPEDFDADTPFFPGILEHARLSAGAALDALQSARAGEMAFSLMRPPGHHATRTQAMGFCYLNNIAIAACEALATGAKRVAIYDFDVHHGNGTEAILLNQKGAAFFSVHQFPNYPGTGANHVGSNSFNFSVPPHTPRTEYRAILGQALDELKKFQPDIVGISAGFDAYARDPLAEGTLQAEDFYWLGDSFRKLDLPVFSLLEGGYSKDLPELIFAYLKGLAGK